MAAADAKVAAIDRTWKMQNRAVSCLPNAMMGPTLVGSSAQTDQADQTTNVAVAKKF